MVSVDNIDTPVFSTQKLSTRNLYHFNFENQKV